MSQNPDPRDPFQPGYQQGQLPPRTLDYSPAAPGTSKNRWWMVGLRIIAGAVAAIASFALGGWLSALANMPWLLFLPPLAIFGALLFVSIKYQRFGYVTGFVLAPFITVAAGIVLLLIICGTGGMKF